MEFELNEILDIIESDMRAWCEKMRYSCSPECKYYHCVCSTADDNFNDVRKLSATCFGSQYEKND